MIPSLTSYYHRWYHGRPVGITTARREELERLHSILYRAAEYLSLNYREFVDRYMPLCERDMEILEMQEARPFRAGTWRPDYIITDSGQLKICEITSRFFAHGIFSNWYSEEASRLFMERNFPGKPWNTTFPELLDYMMSILEGKTEIYVLKSADRTSEIRCYDYFYRQKGCNVTVIESPEVEQRLREWARPGVFLVSALNQNDIRSYSNGTIRAMIDCGMYSDFRNIFLIHDKRFMSLWYDDSFTSRFLNEDDTLFLRNHAIPTSILSDEVGNFSHYAGVGEKFFDHFSGEKLLLREGREKLQNESIDELIVNKNDYIIKPYALGKSEGVHAGVLTSEEEWKQLLEHPEGMIIQPFLKQRTYRCEWEGKVYDDYLCGMMLCVNDRYFGSGMFRASSLPVTNVGDDRKACCLHTDDPDILKLCDVL